MHEKEQDEEEVIGYTVATPYVEEGTYYIESTAVLPAFQGKGCGKKLRAELLNKLSKMGAKYVYTRATNEAIRNISIKQDFEDIGEPIEKYSGINRTAYLMRKEL